MEWYKVSGVILASALIAMLSGKVADTLVDPTMPMEAALAVADAPPAPAKPQAATVDISGALVMLASADAGKGAKIAKKCASCHSFNKGGKNKVGPNLWNIVNKS
ncbi:MAG: c-type cytochrome, partial [Pseudomonadota bacterium]|nr:c-type cytochrome [Pseudomonadota bacterium]